MRLFAFAAIAFTILLSLAGTVSASQLPEIGSSAADLLTPGQQVEYGQWLRAQLRQDGLLLEDPFLEQWLQDIVNRLSADTEQAHQTFQVVLLQERSINAFATLGGLIAVNRGLILTARREDELAAVLSHEMAHITQRHLLRSIEHAKHDQLPILLGMLAAVIAAQQSGQSSGDATLASIYSALGLMQQRQINYTRGNEAEADRIGIRTLARSGYDVGAMASFFERMAMASHHGGQSDQAPDFLQSHPVTATRLSEAKARAQQLQSTLSPAFYRTLLVPERPSFSSQQANDIDLNNPSLPATLQPVDPNWQKVDSEPLFAYAQERLRVLSADSPNAAIQDYSQIVRQHGIALTDAQRYGLAFAQLLVHHPHPVLIEQLASLLQAHPQNTWIATALAQAKFQAGQIAQANALFEQLCSQQPGQRAIILSYAQILIAQATPSAGLKAVQLLTPYRQSLIEDMTFQSVLARAYELANHHSQATEAYAQVAYLNGRPEQALALLQSAQRQQSDYLTRARIEARIRTLMPLILTLHRQGVHDPDVDHGPE